MVLTLTKNEEAVEAIFKLHFHFAEIERIGTRGLRIKAPTMRANIAVTEISNKIIVEIFDISQIKGFEFIDALKIITIALLDAEMDVVFKCVNNERMLRKMFEVGATKITTEEHKRLYTIHEENDFDIDWTKYEANYGDYFCSLD